MIINDREIGLEYTVGVYLKMADMIAGNPELSLARANFTAAVEMSRAYCNNHGGEPLTEEELMNAPAYVLDELSEAVEAQRKIDTRRTVEAEAPKGKNAKSAGKQG